MDSDGGRFRGLDLSSDDESGKPTYMGVISSSDDSDDGLPQAAEISRPRKLPANQSATSQKRRCSESSLKRLSNCVRIAEFPNEYLERRDGRLFCSACKQWLSEKKSAIASHVLTEKHAKGKEEQAKDKSKQMTYKESLRARDEVSRPVGETLPFEHRAFRVEVVESFLREGIALAKLDGLRPLLEKNNYSLCSSSHMKEYIPMILEEEKLRLKKLISKKPIAIIFDGTTRLGEAIAVVVRLLDDWTIRQVLVRLHTVAKPVTGQDLTRFLNHCLANEYQVDAEHVVAAMRDGASVNSAAIRNLKVLYPNMFDVSCFSHAANNAGRHFDFPVLERFGQYWVQLFSHSCKAKLSWKQRTSASIKTPSNTRWWSLWEVFDQVLQFFGDVKPFLESLDGVSPATVAHLLEILNDEDDLDSLRLQLAAMVDVGKHFVRLTYNLEGDGPLVFSAYTILQEATTVFAQDHCPLLDAVCREIAERKPAVTEAQLRAQTLQGARPAINWYLQKFNGDLGEVVSAFRLARFFDPVVSQSLNITPAKLDALRVFPFLDDGNSINEMKAEVPAYLAAIQDVDLSNSAEKVRWWSQQNSLPAWVSAVRKLLLVQPSSAASERAFSLLGACFSSEQRRALEDLVESSIMLRYNR